MLAEMDPGERRRLMKRALSARKADLRKGERPRQGAIRAHELPDPDDDDDPDAHEHRPRQEPVGGWALRILDEERAASVPVPTASADDGVEGLVVAVEQGACTVEHEGRTARCVLRGHLAAAQQSAIAVGDQVAVSGLDGGPAFVERVLPRRSSLSRPDPKYTHIERVIAANVDAAVIVVSVVAPPLHTRFIDRFLVTVEHGGAQPMICVNKTDLLPDEAELGAELAKLDPYRALGIPVFPCSAEDGSGVAELLAALSGSLCVFVGHSGVGKSSLLNAMAPELKIVTNEVRATDGKGRHTTAASTLYVLPDGARVIDTPGIRSLAIRLDRLELAAQFPEFAEPAARCKYRDCTHTHEPQCEVKAAVDAGAVSAERYDSFMRMCGLVSPFSHRGRPQRTG